MCRDINESVCPWDNFAGEGKDRKSPRGSVGSGGGGGSHKRRGSDPTLSTRGTGGASGGGGGGTSNPSEGGASPHHGKHRSHHQSGKYRFPSPLAGVMYQKYRNHLGSYYISLDICGFPVFRSLKHQEKKGIPNLNNHRHVTVCILIFESDRLGKKNQSPKVF